MERKHFLTAAVAATAGVTAAAAAALGATPMPYATPLPEFSTQPTRSPRPGSSAYPANTLHRHGTGHRPSELEHIHRHLERLISMLEESQAHSDHVTRAIDLLQQADSEIISEMSAGTAAPLL